MSVANEPPLVTIFNSNEVVETELTTVADSEAGPSIEVVLDEEGLLTTSATEANGVPKDEGKPKQSSFSTLLPEVLSPESQSKDSICWI